MTRVAFSENSKKHDGSSEEIYHQYCLIGSFFGLKEIAKSKKLGITDDELNSIVKQYEEEAKSFEPIFSNYLKYQIRLKQSQNNSHSESIKLLPIKNVSDCLEVTDNNLDIIKNVLENLKKTLQNIKEFKDEEYETNDEMKDIISHDEEWDKSCEAPICLKKKCCLEKKIKILTKKKKVSLIRNGSRDYNFALEIKHEKNIKYLMSILIDAKKKIENEMLEKKWVGDVGLMK